MQSCEGAWSEAVEVCCRPLPLPTRGGVWSGPPPPPEEAVSYELHTSKLCKRRMGRRERKEQRKGEEGEEGWGGGSRGMGRSYEYPSMYITSVVQ